MPQAPKIIESLPRDGEKVKFSNYYGDEPSREMRKFCGAAVMRAVETLQEEVTVGARRGGKVFFQCADGKCYHIYCGKNKTRTMSGKFLYNVYIHPDAVGKSNR